MFPYGHKYIAYHPWERNFVLTNHSRKFPYKLGRGLVIGQRRKKEFKTKGRRTLLLSTCNNTDTVSLQAENFLTHPCQEERKKKERKWYSKYRINEDKKSVTEKLHCWMEEEMQLCRLQKFTVSVFLRVERRSVRRPFVLSALFFLLSLKIHTSSNSRNIEPAKIKSVTVLLNI